MSARQPLTPPLSDFDPHRSRDPALPLRIGKYGVIARLGDRDVLLPRAAADKIRERDAGMIVLDHGQAVGTEAAATASEDDAYYAQFQVPDDLVW